MLKALYDQLETHIRGLQALGVESESYGMSRNYHQSCSFWLADSCRAMIGRCKLYIRARDSSKGELPVNLIVDYLESSTHQSLCVLEVTHMCVVIAIKSTPLTGGGGTGVEKARTKVVVEKGTH